MIQETLNRVIGIRANLHALILLAATLTQQIVAARENLKQTEDTIIAEIWSDEQYKNDRVRNEQKRLARINDDRYLDAANRVQQLDMDRARTNADILVEQNVLAVVTTQYQQYMIADYVGGLRFQMQMVQVHSADQTTMEIKPNIDLQNPVPVADADLLPRLADAVLEAYLHEGSKLPELSEIDRKICDIVRSGETRFLDGAALQRVRDLHASLPGMAGYVAPATSPVEVIQDGDQWLAKGASFTDLQSSDDYAYGATYEEAYSNYLALAEQPTVAAAAEKAGDA